MNRLNEKVAVVTGASKGIGASIAKAFAAEGAQVVVNYSSSKEGAESVVAEIQAHRRSGCRNTRRCIQGVRCSARLCRDEEGVRRC